MSWHLHQDLNWPVRYLRLPTVIEFSRSLLLASFNSQALVLPESSASAKSEGLCSKADRCSLTVVSVSPNLVSYIYCSESDSAPERVSVSSSVQRIHRSLKHRHQACLPHPALWILLLQLLLPIRLSPRLWKQALCSQTALRLVTVELAFTSRPELASVGTYLANCN